VPCAALKMKCISTEQGKCERCLRMDRECATATPKPRKRRAESYLGRGVGDMSTLQFAGPSSNADPPPKFDAPQGDASEMADRRSLLARHDLSHTGSKTFISLFSRGLGNFSVREPLP